MGVKKVFTTDFKGDPVEWAVFAAGTVVMVPATEAPTADELVALALRVLEANGPVFPGTPSGDFNPVQLTKFFGEGCAEWFVFFEATGGYPRGTSLFGVYIGSLVSSMEIGLGQRAFREKDSEGCHVVCTSFDLAPKVWSPESHAGFPSASRMLVWLMLLVRQRSANTNAPFVSHEVLVNYVLPMLVQ